MTDATRVCCSMISDTHTAQGDGAGRQGSTRALRSYQASSARRAGRTQAVSSVSVLASAAGAFDRRAVMPRS